MSCSIFTNVFQKQPSSTLHTELDCGYRKEEEGKRERERKVHLLLILIMFYSSESLCDYRFALHAQRDTQRKNEFSSVAALAGLAYIYMHCTFVLICSLSSSLPVAIRKLRSFIIYTHIILYLWFSSIHSFILRLYCIIILIQHRRKSRWEMVRVSAGMIDWIH